MLSLEEIQKRLKDRRLTVVSEKIGVSYPTLLAISKGESNTTYKILKLVSDYLCNNK
jgi:hypothetical protein